MYSGIWLLTKGCCNFCDIISLLYIMLRFDILDTANLSWRIKSYVVPGELISLELIEFMAHERKA